MADLNDHSLKILKDLLPGIIHEINNPLGAVMMNIAILLEDLEESTLSEEEIQSLKETYTDMDEALGKIRDYVQSLGFLSVFRFYEDPTGMDLRYLINHSLLLNHNRLKRTVRVENTVSDHGYLFVNVRVARVLLALSNVFEQLIEQEAGKNLFVHAAMENGLIVCRITREGITQDLDEGVLSVAADAGDFTFNKISGGMALAFTPHEQQNSD
ncbi:hypothetical protein KKF34_09950 [Myxococcota bacterium]|nr:hypothetical protein [Myxococcota bacterium]MBU1383176.1 hypothetical protein [Myxococcota bacterium]MBU1497188.1 hypothetical protein [Myxococcota bacterium]